MRDMAIDVRQQYERAGKRLLLLDYDGTLRDLEPRPELAQPTPEIKQLLRRLAEDSKNTVVVVSGRDHETLEGWFADLPIYCIAEHGAAYRSSAGEWQLTEELPVDWMAPVWQRMNAAVAAVPGTHIETKPRSLVWHYREAKEDAENEVANLFEDLTALAARHKLRVLSGKKTLDVQPLGIAKGSSVRNHFDLRSYDFVLAIGDDLTDEDLFSALPQNAHTIKVGDGETVARNRVADPAAARALLASFVQK